MCEEQDAFDEVFDGLVEYDRRIDEVIEGLARLDVVVEPEQRVVLADWINGVGSDRSVPLGMRLMHLRLTLAVS